MTTQVNTPTPESSPEGVTTNDTPEGAQPSQDGLSTAEAIDDSKGGNKPGQEAAKYRRQLRDTEAERDTLAGSVDSLRKQLIAQNMPHGSKLNADALWLAGQNAADLFTKEGIIDQAKLKDAVKETHQKVGLRFGSDPVPASGTGSREGTGADGPSWSKVMNKAKR